MQRWIRQRLHHLFGSVLVQRLRGPNGGEPAGEMPTAALIPMENPYCSCMPTRHGLQLQPLWRTPTAAVRQHDMAYSCNPCGEPLLQL